MAIDKLQFTKDWNSSTDFPTVETDEAAVRRDMQFLHDETKNYLNDKVAPAIDSVRNDLDAAVKVQDETKHTHGNKALLDTYTQTEADLKRAVEEAHEHENKDVLDGIAGVTQSLGDAADKVPSEAAVSKAIALAGGIPGGGVTGQVLVKASDESMDTQWDTMTADRVGAVRKTGDTMTGDLVIKKAPGVVLILEDSTNNTRGFMQMWANTLSLQSQNVAGDGTNMRQLGISNSKSRELAKSLQLLDNVNGTSTYYNIYGEHNKPTPADIGAVKKTGDTMTGHLSVSTPAYTQIMLNETTVGSRVKMQNGGHYFFVGVQDASTDSNQRQLFIRDKTNKDGLREALQLADVVNGAATYYNVLHTGNLTDHGIGRVGQIEYVGAGEYSRNDTRYETYSVTLDFVPKLAILEVVNTLGVGSPSKTGPVFITGVGKFYYRDRFFTAQDDNYTEYDILKVTEFGTTLSWEYQPAYRQFCDEDYTYRITYFG